MDCVNTFIFTQIMGGHSQLQGDKQIDFYLKSFIIFQIKKININLIKILTIYTVTLLTIFKSKY